MDRIRKRRQKHVEAADLDVTPFMNLMIVLVPVLLLSMVFTHTTVIDLNFPTGDAASGEFDPEAVHLEVTVYNDRLVVADGRGVCVAFHQVNELNHCNFQALDDGTGLALQHGVNQKQWNSRHQTKRCGVHGNGDTLRKQGGLFSWVSIGHRGERRNQTYNGA